ncbi:MAG: peptide-methionine (S)-S-oxide reductase MsrA [Micrococcaceae bacterium]
MTTYILGGGCFWCLDAAYSDVKGVTSISCGYSGGTTANPSYEQVCSQRTGHAEVVKLTFDESIIPSEVILDMFFTMHDPTSLNRQGADVGTQYRSAMFYQNEEQKKVFEAAAHRAQQYWDKPLVTKIEPLETFYPAEDYHQNYYAKNPDAGYCQAVVSAKVAKVRAQFTNWMS